MRVRIAVVDILRRTAVAGIARGRAELEKIGHAIAVRAPDGGDGALEDVDPGKRVSGVERREVDLGVAACAAVGFHAASRSRQWG